MYDTLRFFIGDHPAQQSERVHSWGVRTSVAVVGVHMYVWEILLAHVDVNGAP